MIFESKPTRTYLLELFTSEGCSSCPPAEAWLNNLKNEPGLWREFVPIAFHVDYWDRLGWRDPFASKAWTARQYQYSAQWKSGSVYTPGFVLNGRELRDRRVPPRATETPGVLKCIVSDAGEIAAEFKRPSGDSSPVELHVARLGFDLSTNVKAGENSGRKLRHDFVVLSLERASMQSGKAQIKVPSGTASTRTAIAAWITAPGELEPIQATGGWLR
ncbi:MAG TPA: DUF1223 domain-containing protein [Chthoniobacterales bacterium]|nr:DUF1223 domain-containing protein [Chthoniobacterales bacterium]